MTFPGRQALINGSESTISCNANLAIDYCWFRKSNGKILSVSDKVMKMEGASTNQTEPQEFWYHGLGFGLGECGITLREVMPEVDYTYTNPLKYQIIINPSMNVG